MKEFLCNDKDDYFLLSSFELLFVFEQTNVHPSIIKHIARVLKI